MTKKILLAGYYGVGNIGDDAIMISIVNSIQKTREEVSFEIVSFDPQRTETDFGLRAVYWRDIPAVAGAVLRADLVIIGGGGLFMDYWGLDENSYFRTVHGGISTYGTPARLAQAFGIPWMFYGVGIGPLFNETAREHTRRLFSQAPLAALRDDDSAALLREVGLEPLPGHIHLTADPAFGLEVPPQYRTAAQQRCTMLGVEADKPLLGVSIRYWDRPQPPLEWIPALAEGLREFIRQTSAQILLLPFQIGGDGLTDDLSVCRALQGKIDLPGIHLVEELLHPFEMQALLGGCDMVFGMRLHALLMAINEGAPVLGLAYDPKVSSFMKRGGMEKWACSMPVEPGPLTDLILESWENRGTLVARAQKYRQEMFPLAEKNAELAVNLLDASPRKPSQQNLVSFIMERLEQMQYMDGQVQPLIKELNDKINFLESELNEARSQAILTQRRLDEIESSRTYRLAVFFQNIRNLLLPPGSRREKWFQALLKRPGSRS